VCWGIAPKKDLTGKKETRVGWVFHTFPRRKVFGVTPGAECGSNSPIWGATMVLYFKGLRRSPHKGGAIFLSRRHILGGGATTFGRVDIPPFGGEYNPHQEPPFWGFKKSPNNHSKRGEDPLLSLESSKPRESPPESAKPPTYVGWDAPPK